MGQFVLVLRKVNGLSLADSGLAKASSHTDVTMSRHFLPRLRTLECFTSFRILIIVAVEHNVPAIRYQLILFLLCIGWIERGIDGDVMQRE